MSKLNAEEKLLKICQLIIKKQYQHIQDLAEYGGRISRSHDIAIIELLEIIEEKEGANK